MTAIGRPIRVDGGRVVAGSADIASATQHVSSALHGIRELAFRPAERNTPNT